MASSQESTETQLIKVLTKVDELQQRVIAQEQQINDLQALLAPLAGLAELAPVFGRLAQLRLPKLPAQTERAPVQSVRPPAGYTPAIFTREVKQLQSQESKLQHQARKATEQVANLKKQTEQAEARQKMIASAADEAKATAAAAIAANRSALTVQAPAYVVPKY
jgi:phage tail protein X